VQPSSSMPLIRWYMVLSRADLTSHPISQKGLASSHQYEAPDRIESTMYQGHPRLYSSRPWNSPMAPGLVVSRSSEHSTLLFHGPQWLLWYGATFVQSGIRFYRLTGSSLW